MRTQLTLGPGGRVDAASPVTPRFISLRTRGPSDCPTSALWSSEWLRSPAAPTPAAIGPPTSVPTDPLFQPQQAGAQAAETVSFQLITAGDFLGGPMVKNLSAKVGDRRSIPGPGRAHGPDHDVPRTCAPQEKPPPLRAAPTRCN